MYEGGIESMLQVYLLDLFNFIFNFRCFSILIILPVANIMCREMLFRKLMMLMCMRSQHGLDLFYLSRMPLVTFGTIIGPT